MTTAKSAYPVPVDELLPQARQLAEQLGQLPSRNRLMTELKIGAPKAKALREELQPPQFEDTSEPHPTRLHLVSQTQPTEQANPVPANTTESAATALPTGESDALPEPEGFDPSTETPPSSPVPDADSPQAEGAASSTESAPVNTIADPDTSTGPERRPVPTWPVLLLALPAFVAIWSGWVGLGGLTGFGIVHPLPGIWDALELNTAITLPIGVETYAAYALRVWLSGQVPEPARRFAMVSALGSLALGALGQVAYHLMTAAGMTQAPWWITTVVACLPVAVLGMGAALTHLIHTPDTGHPEVTR